MEFGVPSFLQKQTTSTLPLSTPTSTQITLDSNDNHNQLKLGTFPINPTFQSWSVDLREEATSTRPAPTSCSTRSALRSIHILLQPDYYTPITSPCFSVADFSSVFFRESFDSVFFQQPYAVHHLGVQRKHQIDFTSLSLCHLRYPVLRHITIAKMAEAENYEDDLFDDLYVNFTSLVTSNLNMI